LTSDGAVESVTLDVDGLGSALAVGLEDVDRLDGVLDVASGVDGSDREHGVHSHVGEEVVVAVLVGSVICDVRGSEGGGTGEGREKRGQRPAKEDARRRETQTHAPMILLLILVLATLIKQSLPNVSTLTANCSVKYLTASLQASLYPVMTVVGWILFLTKSLARFNSSAATMTTEVVPSPTSLSCC